MSDPDVSLARARQFALAWGSRVVEIGPAGHVNAASGHGEWPAGVALLRELAAGGSRGRSRSRSPSGGGRS